MASSSRLTNKPGSVVRGPDFFGREQELKELWDLLDRVSVLMLAARRVGKTSLLWRMLEQPAAGWKCIVLSLEDLESESAFVARLLEEACRLAPKGTWAFKLRRGLRQLLDKVQGLAAGPLKVQLAREIGVEWREDAETILEILHGLEHRTLVLLDEFPIFIQLLLRGDDGEGRAQSFLKWFRAQRLDPRLTGDQIRFLLTGSVGLDAVLRAAGMSSHINDLGLYSLRPFSTEVAEAFLERLAEGEGIVLDEAMRQRILELVDWPIPFHLQLLFQQVRLAVHHRNEPPSVELVNRAHQALLAADHRKPLNHWVSRLRETSVSQAEHDLKREILAAAARDQHGVSSRSVLQLRRVHPPQLNGNDVLATLEYDGYLMKVGARWCFASSLLRAWWLKWVATRER